MNKAFTLAEVLITLGIIGVIAAMTIPTIINDRKNKELEAAFNKSYSLISQVMTRVTNEDYGGFAPVITSGTITEFMNNFKKYCVNSADCKAGRNCTNSDIPSSSTGFADFIRSNYKTYNGKNPSVLCNDGLIELNDGSLIFFDWATAGETVYGKNIICVDTNGWKKKPNKYGHDFFMFYINEAGETLPMGGESSLFPETTYCTLTSGSGSNGYGCASKALTENNYFKNLP